MRGEKISGPYSLCLSTSSVVPLHFLLPNHYFPPCYFGGVGETRDNSHPSRVAEGAPLDLYPGEIN